jgi:hypothetical protein
MSANPRDTLLDKDATSEEDIFLEACARQKLAEENEGDNRERALQAIAFRNGQQWPDDIYNQRANVEKRPTLTINHTNTFCVRLKNQLRQQRPRIKCHPTGGGARIEDAEVITGLIRHIETQSNASVSYDMGAEAAIDGGWGYWRIVGEYIAPDSFDQELLIKPVANTFTVYDDPMSIMPAGEDRKWLMISEEMSRAEYKRQYRNADNVEWDAAAPGDQDVQRWESKFKIRLAEYYRIHEVADTLVLMTDGRGWFKSQMPSEETMLAAGFRPVVQRRLNEEAEGDWVTRPTSRRQVQWFRLNGKKVVDRRDLPGKWIPVIRCEGNKTILNGQVIRKGMVEDLMDPARMFNYWRSSETERYALSPKAPWVMAEGQDEGHPEWDDANTRSYSRLVYKPVTDAAGNALPPPQRQPATPIEAGFAQAAQSAQLDLMAVAGMQPENPELQAKVIGGNKYLQRRQGMQDLTHFQFYDNQTYSIMWTGIILLDLIPHYYDTRRMQRIIGDDGVPKMVEINAPPSEGEEEDSTSAVYRVKTNLEMGRYDVVMDTGPDYGTKREEGTEALLGLLATPLGQKVSDMASDLVVRGMDFYGAQDVADRLAPSTPEGMKKAVEGLPKQAQAIVGALQMQVQNMQQVIQQQALEIKYGISKEQLKQEAESKRTAAKIESDNNKAQLQDATKRYDTDVKSVTSRDVAEIGAAAQLLNSQQESRHEEQMADKLIEKGVKGGAE